MLLPIVHIIRKGMKLGKILKQGKKILAGLGGAGIVGGGVVLPFDEATALIVEIGALITLFSAGFIGVLEAIAKVKGWIPLDAELD